MKKFVKATWAAAATLALSAAPAFAANIQLDDPAGKQFDKVAKNLNFPTLISKLIALALVVAAVIFFFMLVIGGIKWIMSGGDKGKTEEARNQITAALVGLVIVFAAWAIARLIDALFGVNILDIDISEFGA